MILYTLFNSSYIDIKELDSIENKAIYVNTTNRCPCACTFCLRQTKEMMEGNSLWLKNEPTVETIIEEFEKYDMSIAREVVFCGFGEPFERIDDIIDVAKYLKEKYQDIKIRINTNGLGDLVNNKPTAPLLKGLIDTISISLNSPHEKTYEDLVRSRYKNSYKAMLDFTKSCIGNVENIVMSVVDIIGEEDIKLCQEITDSIGVTLRVRPFE